MESIAEVIEVNNIVINYAHVDLAGLAADTSSS